MADPSLIVVFFSASIAICALVLPGVSGSFLLLTVGMYDPTIAAVNDRNFAYLAVFALGAILGLAIFVSLLKWLLENRARVTLVIITGLMLGSLRALVAVARSRARTPCTDGSNRNRATALYCRCRIRRSFTYSRAQIWRNRRAERSTRGLSLPANTPPCTHSRALPLLREHPDQQSRSLQR